MRAILFNIILILLIGCSTLSHNKQKNNLVTPSITKDSVFAKYSQYANFDLIKDYKVSRKLINDLVHTKLELTVDWDKCTMHGFATLTLTPHFRPAKELELDAKGFEIHQVILVDSLSKLNLKYQYSDNKIKIALNREYFKNQTYKIRIEYTAKPNELVLNAGNAVSSDKGLFFINPDGKDFFKPSQIWTQGETQSNSVWFPTIDSPNQRCTQELNITVDNKYTTLSNGKLIKSEFNQNGERTDFWMQDKPHAPYLFALIIGKYSVIKDKWRDIPVEYYVEAPFAPFAKAIFGKTPEMLEFFSKRFGVDYPWAKYAQIAVRDYISGAMENTTATVWGDYVQRSRRELLDFDNESIIAHEISHQWFGNLVTLESWSNTTLNEGFATYSEYLWNEYKYGKDFADYEFRGIYRNYMQEAMSEKKDLIRFYYITPDNLFDAHSYSKGALVIHMLRNYLGDVVFFEAIKKYLIKFSYKSVEIHDLRLVFEEVSGEDLNWFFNQWFLNPGHPELEITHSFNKSTKKTNLRIEQKQDLKLMSVYKLPMKVDIYLKDSVIHTEIVVDKITQDFEFQLNQEPLFVNVDVDKSLLCEKNENLSVSNLLVEYKKGSTINDKLNALKFLKSFPENAEVQKIFGEAINHPFWGISLFALQNFSFSKSLANNEFILNLKELALKAKKSLVRKQALELLSETEYEKFDELCSQIALKDSSYQVSNTALSYLKSRNVDECLKVTRTLFKDTTLVIKMLNILIEIGIPDDSIYFIQAFNQCKGIDKWNSIQSYTSFVLRFENTPNFENGLKFIENIAQKGNPWWTRDAGVRAMIDIAAFYSNKSKESIEEGTENKSSNFLNDRTSKVKAEDIRLKVGNIIVEEKNLELKKWYSDYINWK